MKIGPKYKICRRLGSGVFDKCQTQKYVLSESNKSRGKGSRRPRALSDFGKQLLEKQRARFTYGITERQLGRYVKSIDTKLDIDPVTQLLRFLEMRLDNVVYRSGLAASRRHARQLVSHGHIIVNGAKMTIPSHQVTVDDIFAIRETSKEKGPFAELGSEAHPSQQTPHWLSFDVKKGEGKVTGAPDRSDLEPVFDPTFVLEFYSR